MTLSFKFWQKSLFNSGFSMTEALIASTVAIITLGVTAPMFVAQRQYNIDSEITSGAKSVATRCLEMMRQQDPTQLTLTADFEETTPACNIPVAERTQMGNALTVGTRVQVATVDPDSLTPTNSEFASYQCTDAGTNNTNATSFTSRCLTVRISWQGRVIHTVSSVYSRLTGENQ